MDIDIGAPVVAAGGEVVGYVEKVIVDRQSWEMTDIVIHGSLMIGADFIVPLNMIAEAEKGEIVLRASLKELRQMPHYAEVEFEVPPVGGADELAYNPGNILVPVKPPFPAPYPVPPPPPPLSELAHEVSAEPIELSEDTPVEAVDGPLGVVDDVLLDAYTDRVTAFVVRESGFLSKDITIPVEWIAEASQNVVKVAATKAQAEHLLGPPEAWYLPVKGRKRRRR